MSDLFQKQAAQSGFAGPLITSNIELSRDIYTPDKLKDSSLAGYMSKDLPLSNFEDNLDLEIALGYLAVVDHLREMDLKPAADFVHQAYYLPYIAGKRGLGALQLRMLVTTRHEVQGENKQEERILDQSQQKQEKKFGIF